MREILLVLHIVGAALWIGGGILGTLARNRFVSESAAVALRWMSFEESLSRAFFPVAAVLTLLSGISLVVVSPAYEFLDLFVMLGLAVFLVSAVGNSAFAARRNALAVAALADGDEKEARERFATTRPYHLFEIAFLLFVLVAMVYRLGA